MAKTTKTSRKKTTNKRKDNKPLILIAAIAIVAIAIIGVTYAIFSQQLTGEKTNIIEVGTLTLTLDESASEGVHIQNAVPVTEEYALGHYTPYTFTVTNTGTVKATYNLTLVDDEDALGEATKLEDTNVRYSLSKIKTPNEASAEPKETTKNLLSALDSRTLDEGETLAPGDKVDYTLYLWVDQDATNEIAGQKFAANINIDAVQQLDE